MAKIKHEKSPTLAAVRAEWSKPMFDDQRSRDLLARILDYPHNGRAEVFCWLWVNHAELSEMRRSWQLRPTWRGVAVAARPYRRSCSQSSPVLAHAA